MSNSPACGRILITFKVKYLFLYTGINAKLYESLSFYIFRWVKIKFLRVTTDFWGSNGRIGFIVPLDNFVHIQAAHTIFFSDFPARCCRHGKDPMHIYGDKVIKPYRYHKNRRFGSGEAGHLLLNTIENR